MSIANGNKISAEDVTNVLYRIPYIWAQPYNFSIDLYNQTNSRHTIFMSGYAKNSDPDYPDIRTCNLRVW